MENQIFSLISFLSPKPVLSFQFICFLQEHILMRVCSNKCLSQSLTSLCFTSLCIHKSLQQILNSLLIINCLEILAVFLFKNLSRLNSCCSGSRTTCLRSQGWTRSLRSNVCFVNSVIFNNLNFLFYHCLLNWLF